MSPDRSASEIILRLRIVLVRPPPDVAFCIQGKTGEFLAEARSVGADLTFGFDVRAAGQLSDGSPRFLGRTAQGPPQARFVYVCSGRCAGDTQSCWTRRAKVPLAGIDARLIRGGRVLEARIDGRSKDGGPACGTVPILDGGWRAID